MFSSGVFAKPVAREDAAKAVSGWLKQPGRGLRAPIGNAVKETAVFTDAAGKPEYYVVYLQPSGFVIVPADDLVEPIICFSPSGAYVASDKNPLGALVMRDIPGRLAVARGKQPAGAAQARLQDAQRKWDKFRSAAPAAAGPLTSPPNSVSDVRVAPLTQTTWSQACAGDDTSIACYNYYTPGASWPTATPGSSSNDVCGCVATAMAQLMYFTHSISAPWLSAGVGTVSSYYYVNGVQQPSSNLRGGNGSGGPYDWADMVLSPSASITATQCQAIGALCYDAGISVHMQYTSNSSGAYMTDASSALKSVFKYSNSICGGDGADNIGAGLTTMLNSNLDAGFPCLLGILSSGGGHAIVPDGYGYESSTLYHHLNLGWSGAYTAWYNLPNIPAGGYDFTSVTNCLYNIYTSGGGEIISGRVLDPSSNPVSGATVQAVRTGGGSWTTTTNSNGIYAFAHVPSASTYTLSVITPAQAYGTLTAVTGTSAASNTTSGNVWGKDFVVASLPAPVLSAEPPYTPGTSNTPSWSSVLWATNYWAEYAQDSLFGTPLGNSGWIPGLSTQFTGLTPGSTYYYHVKARVGVPSPATTWSQASQAAFLTDTLTNATADAASNSVILSSTSTPVASTVGSALYTYGARTTYTEFNVYQCTTNVTLSQIEIYLNISTSTPLEFVVYGSTSYTGTYNQVFSATLASSGTGTGFYSSGAISVPLVAGNYYAIGAAWSGTAADGVDIASAGSSTAFGTARTGGWGASAYPAWTGFSGSNFTDNTYRLYQRLTTAVPAYSSSGTVVSTPISPSSFDRWTTLSFTDTTPANTTLTVDVLDGAGNVLATNVSSGTDLHGLGITQPTIKLRGNLATTNAQVSPSLGNWTVQWFAPSSYLVSGWSNVVSSTQGATYTLTVQSNPPAGIVIGSSTGHNGTTNYTVPGVEEGTSVNLAAPATDPTGYTFSQWTVNGTGQTAGQKSITFTMTAATTAVAQYTLNTYTLTVQSTPPTGLSIGSSTSDGGTTNYAVSSVAYGTSVNLQAPATDPTGYTFSQWAVNGTAQTAGQKSITFTITAATTAVAQYTLNTYTLTVQSTPPTGLSIGSVLGYGGVTNYTIPGIAYATSVDLEAPATDPAGYTFSQWVVNGVPASAGAKDIGFAMSMTTTAVAQYTTNTYTLSVQSTPATGIVIISSTGDGGTTNYTVSSVAYGASVNLQAPATDPSGLYAFSQWAVNGVAQTPGQNSITFPISAATTAVAQYNRVIIYVNQNATGANNGTSWTNAFVLLQSALNVAVSGNQIWVAAGTYAPTSDYGLGIGAPGMHFEMVSGVGIYGGFAGTERRSASGTGRRTSPSSAATSAAMSSIRIPISMGSASTRPLSWTVSRSPAETRTCPGLTTPAPGCSTATALRPSPTARSAATRRQATAAGCSTASPPRPSRTAPSAATRQGAAAAGWPTTSPPRPSRAARSAATQPPWAAACTITRIAPLPSRTARSAATRPPRAAGCITRSLPPPPRRTASCRATAPGQVRKSATPTAAAPRRSATATSPGAAAAERDGALPSARTAAGTSPRTRTSCRLCLPLPHRPSRAIITLRPVRRALTRRTARRRRRRIRTATPATTTPACRTSGSAHPGRTWAPMSSRALRAV